MDSDKDTRMPVPEALTVYQIRIRGCLDQRWTEWFDGMSIAQGEDGDTLLTGPAEDQAALHGLIKKVRDLGMTLVSINSVLPSQPDTVKQKTDQHENDN